MMFDLSLSPQSNLYSSSEESTPPPEQTPHSSRAEEQAELKIPFETISLLMIIAQRVGGDFGMQVKVGEPGAGSFFNTEQCTITLDPLHIIDDPSGALFVAFHEGMHRRITPGIQEMGLTKEDARKLFDRLGFMALYNSLEDTAVNTSGVQIFPGMAPHMQAFYDAQFAEENAKLGIPEEFLLSSLIGRWPKFAKYCSELIRDWHQHRFSKDLDQDVHDALNATIKTARELRELTPRPHSRDKKEIIRRAQERLEIANQLYPILDKLIAIDKEVEGYRQMMQDVRKNQNSISDLAKAIQEAWKNEDADTANALQKEMDRKKQQLSPFDSLPEELKKALLEAMENALKEQLQQIAEKMQALEQEIKDAQEKQQAPTQHIKDLQEQLKSAQGDEASALGKKLAQAQQQLAEQQGREREAKEALQRLKDSLTQSMLNGSLPMSWDQMSGELKQALKDLFNSLGKPKQDEYKNRAQKELERFEDQLNQELEGKLNPDKPPKHRETTQQKSEERRVDNFENISRLEHEELLDELRQQREEKMTDYERAFRDLAPQLNEVYRRLEDVFIREKIIDWIPGYASGSKVSLQRAMQGEADPNLRGKMWLRRIVPGEKDEAFVVLVDVSGSMGSEGKFWETFKAGILLAELFERLHTPVEFLSFSDDVRYVKHFEESIKDGVVRSRFNTLVHQRGGTDDVLAIKAGYRHLLHHPAQYKFILMLSDAGSNYMTFHQKLMEKIRERQEVVVVHFGVGRGTSDSHGLYPYSYGDLRMNVTAEERKKGEKTFCEVLCDVVEDIVLRPDIYRQYCNPTLEH